MTEPARKQAPVASTSGGPKPPSGGTGGGARGPFGGGTAVGGGGGTGPGGPSGPGGGGGGMKMPPIDQLKNRPLGRVLIKMGRLTREQVHQALGVQVEQQKNKG